VGQAFWLVMIKEWLKIIVENWQAKLVSIILSFAVWIYVQQSKLQTVNISVPVIYTNKPDNLYYREDPSRYIKMTLQGREENIKFPTGSFKVYVDLRNAVKGKSFYNVIFDKMQLPEKVNLLEIPEKIEVNFDATYKKKLFVKALLVGEVADGYKRGRIQIVPDEVWAEGPESMLKGLNIISTLPINIEGVKENIIRTIQLDAPAQVSLVEVQSVDLKMLVYQENLSNEKIIDSVPIQILNLDPALSVHLSTTTIRVHIQGDPKNLAAINSGSIQASIDLEGTRYNSRTNNILPFATESGIQVSTRFLQSTIKANIVEIIPETITVRFDVKPEFREERNKSNNNTGQGSDIENSNEMNGVR